MRGLGCILYNEDLDVAREHCEDTFEWVRLLEEHFVDRVVAATRHAFQVQRILRHLDQRILHLRSGFRVTLWDFGFRCWGLGVEVFVFREWGGEEEVLVFTEGGGGGG